MQSNSGMKIAVICSSNMNRSMEAHAFLRSSSDSVPSTNDTMNWNGGLKLNKEWKKVLERVERTRDKEERRRKEIEREIKSPATFSFSKKGFCVKSFGTGDKVKLPGPAPDRPNCYEFGITYDEIYQDLIAKDKALYTQNGLLHMLDRNRRIKPRPERFQSSKDKFDVVVTCEERVYDQVIESLENRTTEENTPVHVINIDIQDNHEEATIGAFLVCELVTMMSQSQDLDNDIDELLQDFESKCQRPILHCVWFY